MALAFASICLGALAVPRSGGLAQSEERVALVIGNSGYQHTRVLPNAKNDARAIAGLLRKIGFEVTEVQDLTYRPMREAVRAFGRTAAGADIALVYYAGHGLEVAGENYLVPTDAKLASDGDLEYEAITLASLLDAVRGRRRLGLVILDACRNNPLGGRIALRSGVTRSVSRGLARIEPHGDVLVAYAAKAGTLALDGSGQNSPYAEALIEHLPTPGVDVIRVFGRVKEAVLKATGNEQEPWIYGSPGGDAITLVPGAPGTSGLTPPVQPQARFEEARWAFQDAQGSQERLAAVAERYKDTVYGDYALQELEKVQRAEAERQRLAMLAAEEDRKRADAEARRKAEEEATRRTARPGETFRDCDVCPEMVVAPAGEFMMGSNDGGDEKPVHKVTIRTPFAVGKFEVTFEEWEACVAGGGCQSNESPSDQNWGRGRRPVINISWNDAKEYVAWLSRKTGKSYRLLTETEWEYAARAGTSGRWSFDGDEAKLCEYGNHADQSFSYSSWKNARCKDGAGETAEVGRHKSNAFGLHDMHGNVWEWVEDCYRNSYSGAPRDGSARAAGDCNWRVLRGGSWSSVPRYLRSAYRGKANTVNRDLYTGFRVRRTLTP